MTDPVEYYAPGTVYWREETKKPRSVDQELIVDSPPQDLWLDSGVAVINPTWADKPPEPLQ